MSGSREEAGRARLAMLDGWGAASILFVLACPLLPTGPAKWDINPAVATGGMAVFFTLSGVLITRFRRALIVLPALSLGVTLALAAYLLRPLLLAATFLPAHLSTFRFEQPMIALAKRLTRGLHVRIPA